MQEIEDQPANLSFTIPCFLHSPARAVLTDQRARIGVSLEFEALTESIIGAAIAVHRELGPGFLESIYENAMVLELRKRGLHVDQQVEVPIYYDGVEVGLHRIDLLVEKTIVVELKAVKTIEKVHFAITRSYLKSLQLKHGLILNFSDTRIQPKRVILSDELINPVRRVITEEGRNAGD